MSHSCRNGFYNENIFEITKEHLELLKRGCWESTDFCEFGSVGLDCKRPFGNGSVHSDMAEILGIRKRVDADKRELTEAEIERFNTIFFDELPVVMEIIFATGKIKAGIYKKTERYGHNWKLEK